MTANKIIRLSATPEGFGQTPDQLTPDMFVTELPIQHTHEYFQNDDLGIYVGVWDTTDMTEAPGPYPCDEFMWLLEGEATIKNGKTGELQKAIAGEPFVIPRGYDCQWHQTGYLKKFFLISENPNEPVPDAPTIEGIVVPRAKAPMEPLQSAEPFLTENHSSVQRQHTCYEDYTGKFLAGTWASGPFESKTRPFPFNELACVISGSLTLIDEGGTEHVFRPGDAFFIPAGVICSAQTPERVTLFFAIIQPPQAEIE